MEIDGAKLLGFAAGIPGLEEYTSFAVLNFEDSYPIMWLQSTEEPRISLPVIDPFTITPDYAFDLSDEDVRELELEGPADVQVLAVLVIPEQMEDMTANYAAPVIVNTRTGAAKQVILGGDAHSARTPVFLDVAKFLRGGSGNADTVAKN
jgi:flagellar assembly factor FliW